MILFNDVIRDINVCPICGREAATSNEYVTCAVAGGGHFVAYSTQEALDIVDEIRIYMQLETRAVCLCFVYDKQRDMWRNILRPGENYSSAYLWPLLRMKK